MEVVVFLPSEKREQQQKKIEILQLQLRSNAAFSHLCVCVCVPCHEIPANVALPYGRQSPRHDWRMEEVADAVSGKRTSFSTALGSHCQRERRTGQNGARRSVAADDDVQQ